MNDQHTSHGNRSKEEMFRGIGASKGIAIGPAYLFVNKEIENSSRKLETGKIEEEIERFFSALQRSEKELEKIERVTTQKLGQAYSDLFHAQIMLLHDQIFTESIIRRIRDEQKPAQLVIDEEFDNYIEHFNKSSELLFQERAQDLVDIKNRIIRNLYNRKLQSKIPEGMIIVSPSLSPADIILFSKNNVKGFITETGGKTSHVSLICKSLNIPIIVGLSNFTQKVAMGDPLAINGGEGTAIIHPCDETVRKFMDKIAEESEMEVAVSKLANAPSVTKCGIRLHFYSNIDVKEEIPSIRSAGAEGVGLFRSENLFIDSTKPPKETEQADYYREMAEALHPDPLVIRLFDIGGDKLIYSPVSEPNPNLGWRGIRILIDVPEILDVQLRAILKANSRENIQVLLPMISSIEEIMVIRDTLEKQATVLAESGISCSKPELGAMIEIPAAVEIIDEITKAVDFISIGTNDLTQYTLAVDRNNEIVQDLFDNFHPAIIRQLYRIISTACSNNCHVTLCGDMGSEPLALPFLVGCGLKEFSVVSADIPQLKSLARGFTVAETRELVKDCLSLPTASTIKASLKKFQADHTVEHVQMTSDG